MAEKRALPEVRALTFDVFGTVVNWRSSITAALREAAAHDSRHRGQAAVDWSSFAQEWRDSYGQFTKSFEPGVTPWKDIDTHHRDSLVELLSDHGLGGFFSSDEIDKLSKQWHYLTPWDDSAEGIHALGSKYTTATLSNGNQSLLKDLNETGALGFQKIFSAEDFKAYKPNPATYLGAVEGLGLEPKQVAMVAAHLSDLAAARKYGLRTIYVERREEEAWKPTSPEYQDAKTWVDIWVSEGEGGFLEVARRLGIKA
ncbi:hypothetical protein DL546_006969 [Coniochaeta pulveracea]|uniref:Haloacid dehalogenase, type II n=1 Tax=Coniochaeta pulveracea TaxID=177199 RepID=A0A420YCV8_9PEZI|nr:hypothetical protein DL546_006969 [Coniochaeta pulveracea]